MAQLIEVMGVEWFNRCYLNFYGAIYGLVIELVKQIVYSNKLSEVEGLWAKVTWGAYWFIDSFCDKHCFMPF